MKRSILVLSLSFVLAVPAFAKPPDRLGSMKERVQKYGSHLSYAQASLLAHKQGEKPPWSYPSLSAYSLFGDVYGGFYQHNRGERRALDLYTGKRAVDESLQLHTLDSIEQAELERTAPLDSVEPLKIASHPWNEMLAALEPGEPVPKIMELIPQDHFAVYFQEAGTMGRLEQALRKLSSEANTLFDIDQSLAVRQQVSQRLGLEQFEELEPLLGETVFISEDLDFFPNTHYALAFKGDALAKMGANLVLDSPNRGRVGDYYVVATNAALYQRIAETYQGPGSSSMHDALDFRYAWTVLDSPRDGMVYFSESFILKLVSPAYRINAARRLSVLQELETRQYAVLAYRCLTGEWPTSFPEMVKEGYLAPEAGDRAFLIGSDGVVEHKVWGSLYGPKVLSEVPLLRVTSKERDAYRQFVRRYSRFWTEFFDPIGVAFQVDKVLVFHTIVLPLINSSEYHRLSLLTGGEPLDFRLLESPLKETPLSFHSRFNFGELLRFFDTRRSAELTPQEREQQQDRINRRFNESYKAEPPIDLFALVGPEMAVHAGAAITPDMKLDEYPLYFSFQLLDTDEFRRCFHLMLPGSNVVTNSHAGKEYHEWKIMNDFRLFALYERDFVHLTLNRSVMRSLCEAQGQSRVDTIARERLGSTYNIFLQAQSQGLASLLEQAGSITNNRLAHRQLRDAAGYALDYQMLWAALGREEEAARFLTHRPTRLYGVPIEPDESEVRLGGKALEEIDFEFRYVTRNNPAERSEGKTLLSDLQRETVEFGSALQGLAVGLEFTEEGLSTRVALNNPAHAQSSPLSPLLDHSAGEAQGGAGKALAALLGCLLIAGALGLRRHRTPRPEDDHV